jgi:CelD/BcsL family acetyltransferase involved in cellulose biosynthesis
VTTGAPDVDSVGLQRLDPVTDQRWRNLVDASASSSVFHTPEWLMALQRTYGYEPVAFVDASARESLTDGLLFCRVRSPLTGHRYVSLPFSDHCEPLVEDPHRLMGMLERLRDLGNREGRYIEIKPIRPAMVPEGFEPTQRFFLHVIDLRPDLDAIFGACHRNHMRRAVRKAERVGVVIDVGRTESSLHDFYLLHKMTRRRHHAPVQPLSWFRNLTETFGDRLRVYRARYDGRPVASILTLQHKQTLVYKYGCSDLAYKRLGATPALFWRAIVDAKSAGCIEVDLGRSDLGHDGLIAFKEHLGGRRSMLTYYRYTGNTAGFRVPRWLVTLQRVLTCAPESVQLRAGNVFYKHFG